MRTVHCLDCGKTIFVSANGPFKCDKCKSADNKNKPKFGGISG
jgi:endogenous inhibitor of DNA gyrase (YacG/DUF329 family)